MVFSQSNLCYKPKNRHIIAINFTLCFVSDLLQIVYWKIFCHSHWPLCIALQWFQQKKNYFNFTVKVCNFLQKVNFFYVYHEKSLSEKLFLKTYIWHPLPQKRVQTCPKHFVPHTCMFLPCYEWQGWLWFLYPGWKCRWHLPFPTKPLLVDCSLTYTSLSLNPFPPQGLST